MSHRPSWLRAGAIGFVIVMFATACGSEEPAPGSPTSQAPSDAPVSSGSQATATDSASAESASISAEPASGSTESTGSSPTPETTEPAAREEAAAGTSSITVPTTQPSVNGDGGCPAPLDAPTIVRPVAADNPHPPPSHLEMAVAPWPTDWSRTTIDTQELGLGIHSIDPRDLIRPLDRPVFVDAEAAREWLSEADPGMLVRIGDDARFYPLRVLTRHEIVNDRFGDRPVLVTYCPLCNTAVAFDPVAPDGAQLRFGVSGLLRHSDLVMWDLETTSLWQQVTGEPIVGAYAGGPALPYLPSAIVAFSEFAASHPDGCVLGPDQEFGISYGVNPYIGYSSSSRPFLFGGELDDSLPALSRVVGVSVNNQYRAYSFDDLATRRVINDTLDEVPIAVMWGAAHTADALDDTIIANGRPIGTGVAFVAVSTHGPLTFDPADDDLFTDRQTQSTWNLLGQAVDGPLVGAQLEFAPHRNEFWFAWHAFFGADGELWAAS
ncbi:MAG: DUF3179 domain-containing protein [bacterium]|nr:DUF3179 domain-containing protein [bacterium]